MSKVPCLIPVIIAGTVLSDLELLIANLQCGGFLGMS